MLKFSIYVLIIFIPQICSGQKNRLDTLLTILESEKGNFNHTSNFCNLISVLGLHESNAYTNIILTKIYYGDKELKEIEIQYKMTRIEVHKYIDTMIFYNKDQDYTFNYDKFNSQLEKALISIRELNILFQKYNYTTSKYPRQIIIDKKSTIKKLVKYTRKWKNCFSEYYNGDDKQGHVRILNSAYWKAWEDDTLILRLPKEARTK